MRYIKDGSKLKTIVELMKILASATVIVMLIVLIAECINDYNTPKTEVWQYKGHDMLRYDYQGNTSICHSPECRKCLNAFD